MLNMKFDVDVSRSLEADVWKYKSEMILTFGTRTYSSTH